MAQGRKERNQHGLKPEKNDFNNCPIVQSKFSTDRYNEGLTGFVDFKGLLDFSPRIIPFVQLLLQQNYKTLNYSVSTSVPAEHDSNAFFHVQLALAASSAGCLVATTVLQCGVV